MRGNAEYFGMVYPVLRRKISPDMVLMQLAATALLTTWSSTAECLLSSHFAHDETPYGGLAALQQYRRQYAPLD